MRPSKAIIDLAALRANLEIAARLSPASRNMAVIKANAYGHGMVEVAAALEPHTDALAVATIEEAFTLRTSGIEGPLLVLQGATSQGDVEEAAARGLWLMLHEAGQVESLKSAGGNEPITVWLKIDTGMHRLGFSPAQAASALETLAAFPRVTKPIVLCTHLACADDLQSPVTGQQLSAFSAFTHGRGLPLSIANSAGIMHWAASHAAWNRPGIMLYGCDPTDAFDRTETKLKPVMSVVSEIMAIRDLQPGEGVGYGHRWKAESPARIGTISLGYGDGYPRHAPSGTPVLVNGKRAPLVGTVSMDMITVDLTGHDDVRVGDPVEAWGKNLLVNEVANHAGTIGYELLAGMTSRLPRVFV
jgi:alanine racemase